MFCFRAANTHDLYNKLIFRVIENYFSYALRNYFFRNKKQRVDTLLKFIIHVFVPCTILMSSCCFAIN